MILLSNDATDRGISLFSGRAYLVLKHHIPVLAGPLTSGASIRGSERRAFPWHGRIVSRLRAFVNSDFQPFSAIIAVLANLAHSCSLILTVSKSFIKYHYFFRGLRLFRGPGPLLVSLRYARSCSLLLPFSPFFAVFARFHGVM